MGYISLFGPAGLFLFLYFAPLIFDKLIFGLPNILMPAKYGWVSQTCIVSVVIIASVTLAILTIHYKWSGVGFAWASIILNSILMILTLAMLYFIIFGSYNFG
jgi:hypothetical protein